MTKKDFTTRLPTAEETHDHAVELLGSGGICAEFAPNLLLLRLVHVIEAQTTTIQAVLSHLEAKSSNTK